MPDQQITPSQTTSPARTPRPCDHCEEAPVETFRIMHGPLGPHELGLCGECADDFDQMIACQYGGV